MNAYALYSQIINGSFENTSGSDLSSWEWTCGAQSFNNAPQGGGNWCIKVSGGNYQGCFPGYAYQKIPSVTIGQIYILTGWTFAQTSPLVGIYFGKINNGVITTLAGDTTSSGTWKQLSIQSGFTLLAGDTALVILYGGQTGGPVQGYGYFDLIDLQKVTGIFSPDQKQSVKIISNQFSGQTIFKTDCLLKNATLTVYNLYGQAVRQINHIAGQTITLDHATLPVGLYFIQLSDNNKSCLTFKIIITNL